MCPETRFDIAPKAQTGKGSWPCPYGLCSRCPPEAKGWKPGSVGQRADFCVSVVTRGHQSQAPG